MGLPRATARLLWAPLPTSVDHRHMQAPAPLHPPPPHLLLASKDHRLLVDLVALHRPRPRRRSPRRLLEGAATPDLPSPHPAPTASCGDSSDLSLFCALQLCVHFYIFVAVLLGMFSSSSDRIGALCVVTVVMTVISAAARRSCACVAACSISTAPVGALCDSIAATHCWPWLW